MRRHFYRLILLLVLATQNLFAFAITPQDSLIQIIKNASYSLEIRTQTLLSLLWNLQGERNITKINTVCEDFLKNEVLDEKSRFSILTRRAIMFGNSTLLRETQEYYAQTYEFYKQNSHLLNDSLFLWNYVAKKNNLGKNTEAIAIGLEAIKSYEKNKRWNSLAATYYNLGNCYMEIKQDKAGKECYENAIKLARKTGNFEVMLHALQALGINAMNSGQFKESEQNFLEALKIAENTKTINIPDIKNNLGILYSENGRYKDAARLYSEAENIYRKSNNQLGIANVTLDKGYLNIALKKHKNAIDDCTMARNIYLQLEDIHAVMEAYECLFEAAKTAGDYKSALNYYIKHELYKDSLVNASTVQKVTELRKDFEFEKEKEAAANKYNLSIQEEKTVKKYFMYGLILVGGLLFFAFRGYLIKTKANSIISSQNVQLAKFNQANENLIYSLSHDIKEPMLGVKLLLRKMDSPDPTIQRATKSIADQVTSINNIVNNLLQIKKGGSTQESIDPTQIHETIQKVLSSLNYKIIDNEIAINDTIDYANLSLELPASKQKFYLAFQNLMTNAIKHSPHKGTIDIYAKTDGIYIRDYGSGFELEHLNEIGKQAQSNGSTTMDEISGIGLVIVNSLLSETGMTLHFTNALGGGAEVGLKKAQKTTT